MAIRRHLFVVALAFLADTTFVANAQSQSAPEPLGRLIDIGGRRLHIHCVGEGSPAVVIENGSGSFSIDWALVQPGVSQFVRVCTYDRAGYAWSDSASIRDFPEQVAADFELLVKKAGLPPPYVLVGQSIGGIYVRDYQRRHPQDVAGVVLVEPTHDEGLAYMINGKPKSITTVSREELREFMQQLLARPRIVPKAPVAVSRPYDRLPPEIQAARLWAETAFTLDQDPNRTQYLGEAERQLFTGLMTQRKTEGQPLGKIPLVVLTNGPNKQKGELAALSENGAVQQVAGSCHELQVCTPHAVIEAIKAVVVSVRNGRQ